MVHSVNKLSSLADFAYCPNIQEIFIRRNNIEDLAEICHLKILPNLINLWLLDNPCASRDNYRMTVLRHLPFLQKLDNILVSKEEVEQANVLGDNLFLASKTPQTGDVKDVFTFVEVAYVGIPTKQTDQPEKDAKPSSGVFFQPSKIQTQDDDRESSNFRRSSFLDKQETATEIDECEQKEKSRKESVSSVTEHGEQSDKESHILQAVRCLILELGKKELFIVQELTSRRLSELI